MAKAFHFEGQNYTLPDDVSDDEALAFINDNHKPAEAAPAADGSFGRFVSDYGGAYARQMGLAARDQVGGLAKGIASAGTLPVDAAVNAGYGAHKLLAKTGAVSQPNADFYYGKGEKGYFPATGGMSDAIDQGLDATGLPKPEGPAEGIVSGVRQGAVGALGTAGLGQVIRGGVGAFLAAEPGVNAVASGVGGGAGAALEANPEIGDRLDSYVPGAKIAAPIAASMLAGTGITAARAFGGHVPGFGSTRTTSPQMQEALSNDIVQGMATDPTRAAAQIRATRALEAEPDFAAPGYRTMNTAAARDTGIAAERGTFHKLGAAEFASQAADNNMALSRAFARHGADNDSAINLRREASDLARQDYPRFGLTGSGIANAPDPVDVTPFLRRLRNEADPLTPDTSTSTRDTASSVRKALNAVSEQGDPVPLPSEGMGPVNRRVVMPERLASIRQDLSESTAPAKPNAPVPFPSAQNNTGYATGLRRSVDDLIASGTPEIPGQTGAPMGFQDYLARQSAMRGEADQRGFLAGLMEKYGKKPDGEGARVFNPAAMADLNNIRQQDMMVPGGRNMSISRLNPERRNFIRSLQNIGERENFVNNSGMKPPGSNTNPLDATAGSIGRTIKANSAPYEKVFDLAARNSLSLLGRLGAPGAMAVGGARLIGRQMQRAAAEGGIPDAVTGVQRRIGQFNTNTPMALQMLEGRGLPERGVGVSTKRQIGREAKFGAQGLLASQLDAREQRRRRRPYGG